MNEAQRQCIIAYIMTKRRRDNAEHLIGRDAWQKRLDECIVDLQEVGLSAEDAEKWFSERQWFWCECMLGELGIGTSKSWFMARCALCKAAHRMQENNGKAGLYGNGKAKPGKPLTYHITEAHQSVIDAMYDLEADRITPEQAMALLHEYDVQKERLGTAKRSKK